MSKKEKVYIFDTTLRDGEQVPGCQLNTNEKVEIALDLEDLGVDIIEAGFPISSPGDFNSVVEIALDLENLGVDIIEAGFPISSPGDFNSVVEIAKNVKRPIICALSRALVDDINMAHVSLKNAKRKRLHTGIGASDIHIKHKFNSTREKILDQAVAAVKYARKYFDDIEFYPEDAGRADTDFLALMVEKVISAGATVINIADTTGYNLPEMYGNKIKNLFNKVPNIDKAIVSVHCHNDLGLATANSLSGLQNGARQVEGTINGIGERAGNTSIEEVVMAIKAHPNLNLSTDIDTKKIIKLSKKVSKLMNMPVQRNKAIVGANAFAHSSGIHQDGFLKNRDNYEIINPEDVGLDSSSIDLTARSGRAALKHRLSLLGYTFSKIELETIYVKFIDLADKKKLLHDEDLIKLVKEKNG